MASRSSMFFCLVLLAASFLVQIVEAARTDCRRTGHGCFGSEAATSLERQNRKMLAAGFKEEAAAHVVKSEKVHEQAAVGSTENVGWELRKVPSGPDPLHHNGNSPKKPRSDP